MCREEAVLQAAADDVSGRALDAERHLAAVGQSQRQHVRSGQDRGLADAGNVDMPVDGWRVRLAGLWTNIVVDPEGQAVARRAQGQVSRLNGPDAGNRVNEASCHRTFLPPAGFYIRARLNGLTQDFVFQSNL